MKTITMKTKTLYGILAILMLFIGINEIDAKQGSSILIIDSIYSESLKEVRKFCIYLPPDFDIDNTYKIIFSTDGQVIRSDNYAATLDSLILSKETAAFVLVGVDSNETLLGKNTTYRQLEYLENESKRFENHYAFFTEEIVNAISDKYSIKFDVNDKCFYGFSNGASYGLTMFFRDRLLFKNYILLSPTGYDNNKMPDKTDNDDQNYNLYIYWGMDELFIIRENCAELIKKLEDSGYKFKTDLFQGGHDRKIWKKQFAETIVYLVNYPQEQIE